MTENQNNDELESFRRQWREEVSTRSKGSRTHPHKDLKSPTEPSSSHVSRQHDHRAPPLLSPSAADRIIDDDEETAQRLQYEEFSNDFGSLRLNDAHKKEGETRQEPQSALEHYEEAVEKETEGKLGDSLNLYRKAYRVSRSGHPLGNTILALTSCSWTQMSTRRTRRNISRRPCS